MDSKLCVGCAEHDSKIKQRAGCMRECCEKRRLYGQARAAATTSSGFTAGDLGAHQTKGQLVYA